MLPIKLEDMTLEDFDTIDGHEIVSSDGHSLGNIDLVFADSATGKPAWLGVWNGIPLTQRRIVPIQGAERDGTRIRVPYAKAVFEQAPSYHEHLLEDTADVHITAEQQAEAHILYGLEPPSGADTPPLRAAKK